jgi:hypothetical protein
LVVGEAGGAAVVVVVVGAGMVAAEGVVGDVAGALVLVVDVGDGACVVLVVDVEGGVVEPGGEVCACVAGARAVTGMLAIEIATRVALTNAQASVRAAFRPSRWRLGRRRR